MKIPGDYLVSTSVEQTWSALSDPSEARILGLDESRHRLVIEIRAAVVAVQLHPLNGHTRITTDTDLEVSGELAEGDAAALRRAWDRRLRRFFERVDLAIVGPQPAPTNWDRLLKRVATAVGWRPRLFNQPRDPH